MIDLIKSSLSTEDCLDKFKYTGPPLSVLESVARERRHKRKYSKLCFPVGEKAPDTQHTDHVPPAEAGVSHQPVKPGETSSVRHYPVQEITK